MSNYGKIAFFIIAAGLVVGSSAILIGLPKMRAIDVVAGRELGQERKASDAAEQLQHKLDASITNIATTCLEKKIDMDRCEMMVTSSLHSADPKETTVSRDRVRSLFMIKVIEYCAAKGSEAKKCLTEVGGNGAKPDVQDREAARAHCLSQRQALGGQDAAQKVEFCDALMGLRDKLLEVSK